MKNSGEKYEEIELVKKDKTDEKSSDGEEQEMEPVKKDETDEKSSDGEETDEKSSDGEETEMELAKDETDEKPSDGEDSEVLEEAMRKSKHDVEQTDGEDDEMDLLNKDKKTSDGEEDPELGQMEKSEHGVKQTDGEDDEELVPLIEQVINDLESRVEAAKSALELIKKMAKEEPIAPTILPIKASLGDESTSSVSHLKNKESSLRDEYTRLIAALKRELADYILSEELSKKAKENVNLSCQLTAQGLKEKELKKHCDDLKKEKEDMLQILKSNEKIIKENKEELSKVAYQERAMLSTLSNKEKAINELNEALKKHEVEKANLLEQAAAAQDLKDKSIKELNKHCDDLKKEKEDMFEKLESKEKMIKKNKEEYLSKLHEVLENHKQENTYLIEELAAKDKILKEGEEMLPKIIQGSPLQWVHDSIPKCMQTCLAPKGSITGDELGTFMGSLVTTTAYNVTYSNSDLKAFLFWNSLANLIGSMFGQICNNIVTQMSQTDMKKEGAKKIFKIIGKSVFWILLGGLIPMLAGGFIKKYWKRLVVTAATALVVKCGSATLWKLSYQIPTWQPVLIVILGIIGIGIAAGIPHLVKVASEKK